ncbi:MAG TPA: UDP-N-acetylglucosamine 2-epimerase (non-hydrolyzing) [Angustibacter sp.]|nr:UDP-N-acetylglucosamine 2-epimerase (non-hydrolyzing) [Angustibacter sp.]
MKILSVVGARPEFLQVAPLCWQTAGGPHEHLVLHTGQHYDRMMSDVFFEDLRLPPPDIMLGVGSGTHGVQTGRILAALDPVLAEQQPDWVVVFGDTNSTVAGALAAVKLHIPVAHVEAGLRSFNRRMPEEINRVVTDHAADLLLAPTQGAMAQLAVEGLASRAREVGDIKTEVTFAVRDAVADRPVRLPEGVDPARPFFVATIHRAENTDDPERLRAVLAGLAGAPHPVVLLAHPRLRERAKAQGLDLTAGSLVATEPLAYPDMVAAVLASVGVITDSGGLQKEAFLLRRPCTTVRTETEWVETVELGWNALCPDPADLATVLQRPAPAPTDATPYGAGDTARRIVTELENELP